LTFLQNFFKSNLLEKMYLYTFFSLIIYQLSNAILNDYNKQQLINLTYLFENGFERLRDPLIIVSIILSTNILVHQLY
jgi:preprotein translocase subunit SecY